MSEVKKIRTHIYGLDDILHGGINLMNTDDDSVVIAIRGARGLDSTSLSLQLMHGISRSLWKESPQDNGKDVERLSPLVYSINRTSKSLSDTLLHMVLSKVINKGIQDHVVINSASGKGEDLLKDIVSKLFKFNEETPYYDVLGGRKKDETILELLSKGIVYYNERTNSLNFQQMEQNDSESNTVMYFCVDGLGGSPFSKEFFRKTCDTTNGKYSFKNKYLKRFFFPIEFWHDTDSANMVNRRYSSTLESIINQLSNNYESFCENENMSKFPCVVIDGFGMLSDDELLSAPLGYIEGVLRKMSNVSILVFDDRPHDFVSNADIIMDLGVSERSDFSPISYNTLEISKCFGQKYAHGKHLCKQVDVGMEVYPNLERRLNEKNFDTGVYSTLGLGLFCRPYKSYFSELRRFVKNNYGVESGKNSVPDYQPKTHSLDSTEKTYKAYSQIVKDGCKTFVEKHQNACSSDYNMGVDTVLLLEDCLFLREKWNKPLFDFKENNPPNILTALFGEQKTHRRILANATTFNMLNRGKDVLVISFSRTATQLRSSVFCPLFLKKDTQSDCQKFQVREYRNHSCNSPSGMQGVGVGGPEELKQGLCADCYSRIHHYRVRMGDISAAELIYRLEEIINVFNQIKSDHRIGLIRVENSDLVWAASAFSFLSKDDLFLASLFKLFRGMRIPTLFICDTQKKGGDKSLEFTSYFDNIVFLSHPEKKETDGANDSTIDCRIERNYHYLSSCDTRVCELPTDKSELFVFKGGRIALSPSQIVDKGSDNSGCLKEA